MFLTWQGVMFHVKQKDEENISAQDLFEGLDRLRTEAGALLKGVRARENMNQIEFAEAIGVTQANLSKMEHGKRPIGKQIAKRIEQVFRVNYKYFLGLVNIFICEKAHFLG